MFIPDEGFLHDYAWLTLVPALREGDVITFLGVRFLEGHSILKFSYGKRSAGERMGEESKVNLFLFPSSPEDQVMIKAIELAILALPAHHRNLIFTWSSNVDMGGNFVPALFFTAGHCNHEGCDHLVVTATDIRFGCREHYTK